MAFPWQVMYQNPPRELAWIEFDNAPSTFSIWRLWNNTATDLLIASIYYDYPFGGGGIIDINLGGSGAEFNIWTGYTESNPEFFDSGWNADAGRRILYGRDSNREFRFLHPGTPGNTPYEIIVTFANGWQVRGVN